MMLHLVRDEKFIDFAYTAFEAVAPGKNTFVIVDDSTIAPNRHLAKCNPKQFLIDDFFNSSEFQQLATYEAVFIHSLTQIHRKIVLRSPASTTFVWIGWGIDYCHLIDIDPLLPSTKKIKSSLSLSTAQKVRRRIKSIAATGRNPLQWTKSIRMFLSNKSFQRDFGESGMRENDVLSKIDFFAPVLENEFDLVKKSNPGFPPEFMDWNYGNAIKDASEMSSDCAPHNGQNILVGNSAALSNNHTEALNAIASIGLAPDTRIVCPLSYGDEAYAKLIVEMGHSLFRDQFDPMLTFMNRDVYWQRILDCSVVVMNHVRQQALGNVLFSLYFGAQVVLNSNSPIFAHLNKIGIAVSRIEDLPAVLASPARVPHEKIVDRQQKLIKHFGFDSIKAKTEVIFKRVNENEKLPSNRNKELV